MKTTKVEKRARKTSIAEKGITLVALVVTIIILLILAGVTLNLVLSNNGLIGRTKQGASKYQNASLNEQEELDKGVEIIDDIEKEVNPLVISKDTGPLGAPLNVGNYGDIVTNYSSKEGLIWRLFYEDANNIYLISETTDGDYPDSKNLLNEFQNKSQYTSGADVSEQGKVLLPLLGGAVRSNVGSIEIGTNSSGTNLLTAENTARSIKGVAYLCDTSDEGPWKDYKAGIASWAMGTPTIELYAASFNATHQSGEQILLGIENYGYTQNINDIQLKKSDNGGIYCLTGAGSWWLAGPDANPYYDSEWHMKCIFEGDWSSYQETLAYTNKVRPIVCLQKTNFTYQLKTN